MVKFVLTAKAINCLPRNKTALYLPGAKFWNMLTLPDNGAVVQLNVPQVKMTAG
jgi:hypothetical protein